MTPTMAQLERPQLEAIEQYALSEVPHDPALDDIARLAAQLCGTPVGLVGFLEQNNIQVLGRFGTELDELPRLSTPCDTTAEASGVYQIPDAHRDPAYAPAGIQLGERLYRFFAGAPVQTPLGVAIGCVCVLDTPARKLSPAQIDSLEALSHMVTTRLELVMRVRETHRAAREQQRVEAALKVERNFVAAVLDTVGALVVVFDTAGRIVRFNRACEIISGYPSAALVGRYAWERLIPEEDVADYIEGFEKIRQGHFPATFDWLPMERSGASRGQRRRCWTQIHRSRSSLRPDWMSRSSGWRKVPYGRANRATGRLWRERSAWCTRMTSVGAF